MHRRHEIGVVPAGHLGQHVSDQCPVLGIHLRLIAAEAFKDPTPMLVAVRHMPG